MRWEGLPFRARLHASHPVGLWVSFRNRPSSELNPYIKFRVLGLVVGSRMALGLKV